MRALPRFDLHCLSLSTSLGRVSCLGFVGADFCKEECLAGLLSLGAYGRSQGLRLLCAARSVRVRITERLAAV